MNRRATSRIAARLALAAAAVLNGCELADPRSSAPPAAAAHRTPPRVLLVTWDTVRADRIGACGARQARTPTFDALAARGLLYERAYAAAPITLPSHATLLTGVLPQSHGVRDNAQFQVAPAARLLSEAFADAGCATGAFVGAYVLDPRFGLAQGFATYDAPEGASFGEHFSLVERPADAVAGPALRFIDGLAADAGFLLWLHFYDPHHPHAAPATSGAGAPGDAAPLDPSAAYDAEIAFCDAQLARVLERLAARGLDRGLLTVVTADHGESLHEHGEETHGVFVYDATMRVPLVVAPPPPGASAGTRITTPVSLADVAPTLLAWSGLERSLLPDARGPTLPTSDAEADAGRPLLLESFTPYYAHRWHPLRALVWRGRKFVDAPRRELYDLAADPGETHDLLAAEGRELINSAAGADAEVAERMAARLKALVAEQPALDWREHEAPSPEVAARLLQLGYASAAAAELDEAGFAGLPDPKERIGDVDLKDRIVALLRAGYELLPRDRAAGLQQFARARALVEQLRANHAGDPSLDGLTATLALAVGDHTAALEPLERVVSVEPREGSHHHNLAICYAATGEAAFARREMEKAISLAPHALRSLRWLVQFHRERQDAAAAAWWLARLVECPGQSPAELADVRKYLASTQRLLEESKLAPRAPDPVTSEDLLPERWLAKARERR